MNFIKSIIFTTFLALIASCSGDTKVGNPLIIPEPQKIEVKDGVYAINSDISIGISEESLKPMAEFLQGLINKATGFNVPISNEGSIMLSVDTNLKNIEGYTLNVDTDGIKIVGGGYGGVLYGIETLRQLMPKEFEAKNSGISFGVNHVSVEDAPNFTWRGYMLDVSRHFYSPSEVKTFLDMMAFYKLNKFHWHLTDDQGWRIEIKQYPLLTEKGAWREFNSQDRTCQKNAIEQENTDFDIDPTKMLINGTDTLYGGFYTQKEIIDIVAYAKSLNIDVIPEVDMPGHFLSAVENYKGVACSDQTGWGEMFSSPVCPGKESALEFCKNIYDEVFALFPYEYVHLGADEVEKINWSKCKDCQARIREHNLKDEKELQAWFVKYMEKYFNDNDKKLIGWDEILEGGLSETATLMWWRNWVPDAIPIATAQGNQAISSPNFTLYFDAQQDLNSLKNVYMYNPIIEGLSEKQIKLLLGVQANLWAEWIPSMNRAEYMTYPRMLALSEIAWADPSKKDWDSFLNKVVSHLQTLDVIGVNYRPLDLTGFNKTNTFLEPSEFKIECAQKGVQIFYTTDGTTPTMNSTRYTTPIMVNETTTFKFRTFRPNGTAADIVETKVIIEGYATAASDIKVTGDGLSAKWYDFRGNKCADITTAKFNKEFSINTVSIPEGAEGNIGLIIEGYFEAQKEDIYTFKLLSDDGSMMYINDIMVIDNDGAHSPREVSGQKALGKGLHKFKVEYFDHNGGQLKLVVLDSKGNIIENAFKQGK